MKVSELIGELQKLNGNLDILCSTEDESFLAKNHLFRLLEITHVGVIKGQKVRGNDGLPFLILEPSSQSQQHVLIEVTADF